MTFSEALQVLRDGVNGQLPGAVAVTRDGWNGKGLFVMAQFPTKDSKMGNPYLYIDAKALGGERNPWVPSQTDLFADDWKTVAGMEKAE